MFLENSEIINSLEKDLVNNSYSHAYLFCGSKGIGKFSHAKNFARAILKEDSESIRFFSGIDDYEDADLFIVKSDGNIKKEEIEEIIETSFSKPFSGSHKIVIIDDFDKVTVEGQNALLKTLEEPMDYLILILISSTMKKILPTIISRCRVLKFSDVTVKKIENFLKKENIIKAFKENIKFHKLLTLKERISLIGIMGIWIVLENGLIQILPDALIKNADFNRYFLKNLIISSRFRIYLLEYIIYTLIIMVLMIVFYQYLIGVMGKHEPELLKVKVDLEFNRLFDRTLLKAQIHGNRFFQSLDKYFFETHFYQKYRGMINLVFWPCMFILITYLFPNSIYILSAILIVVLLMYFAASIIIRYEKRKNGQEFEDDSGLLFLPYRLIKRTLNNSRLYNHHPRMVTALLAFISVCLVGMYLEQPLMLHHPWVIGHRGSIYGVENTDGAIMTAADKGADYAEIDVQLSKDGVPVVIHDADLSRLAHKDEKVKNMTAKQLSETLVYHNEYTDKIPTLDHLIKKLKKNSTKMGLLIELKVEGGNGEKLAKKIIDVIEKNDYQKQAIYMSLDLDTVQYLQSQRPEWWIGYCIYGSAGDIEGSLWNQGIDFLAIEENRATVSFVEKANRNWVPVYVWTVDDESRMIQYLELGVSGIITNYPNRGRKAVDKFKENNYQYYYHHGSGYPDS